MANPYRSWIRDLTLIGRSLSIGTIFRTPGAKGRRPRHVSYLTWTTNLSVPCPSGLKPAGRTSAPQWSAAGSEYPFAERDLGSRPAMRPYNPPTAMGGGRKAGTAVHRRGGQWQLTEAGMVAVVACTTPVASLVPRHQPRPTGHLGPAPRTHRLGHRLPYTPAPRARSPAVKDRHPRHQPRQGPLHQQRPSER